jgi:GNAT superfamily N-acetyltransferase
VTIEIAVSDTDIAACYPVMHELRPHIGERDFVTRIRQLQKSGYRLVCLRVNDAPVAVAGIRLGENLAWGRFLYVDDLVTVERHRSKGYGQALLEWIKRYAANARCNEVHLDSAMQRRDAHRFYEREGVAKAGFHFAVTLPALE